MLTIENGKKWLAIFDEKITANKDYLSELDTPIGDGDHGNNMYRGMSAVMEAIKEKDPQQVPDLLKLTAMTLISKVGGASGPLYGTAFLEMAKGSAKTDEIIPLVEKALEGIEKRGNSQPGEKTMLDVWMPALTELKSGDLTVQHLQEAAEKTKDIVATKGRASYLGERSLGHIDPGAMSSCYLFEAMIEAGVIDE